MGIELTKYVKIKNRYCLIYFGPSKEYLVQLRLLRPILEKKFPGLEIHICCRDEDIGLLDKERSLTMSQLRLTKNKFAHVYEFLTDNQIHPIENLLIECDINEYYIEIPKIELSNKCYIVSTGSYPTKNLTTSQIKKIETIAITQGYEISNNIEKSGWVIGVESIDLFEAASKGLRTTLVKTGTGHNLYKKMFNNAEIIDL